MSRYKRRVPRFLFRYTRVHDDFSSLRNLLIENKWFFSSRVFFDDQADMTIPPIRLARVHQGTLQMAREHLQRLWNRMGVLCFSENLEDLRMWRLYADDGKGVCLRMSCDSFRRAYSSGSIREVPLPVKYSDDPRLPWNVLSDERESEEVVAESLIRKTTNWEYQREWRIVRNEGGYGSLPVNALCGLIFGWDVSLEARKEIENWVTRGQRHLSFQEAVFNHDRVTVRNFRFR